MSKKNRFNKFRKNRGNVSENAVSQEKPKEKLEEKKEKEYNTKSDFLSLGIIFAVFIGALIGLYYYDRQSNILAIVTERLMKIFG